MKSTLLKSLAATAGVGAFAYFGANTASADTITVQAGDTLNKLAQRYNTSVSALAATNQISNINFIFVGQQLQTDGNQATTTTNNGNNTSSTTYTVQAGDTLNRIAAKVNVSVATLASVNGISNVDYIFTGQTLNLQGGSAQTSSAQTQTTQQQTTPAQSAQSTDTSMNGQLLAAVNAYRQRAGLSPVTLDNNLNGQAAARLANGANNYVNGVNNGLPTNHMSTNGEVVAFGWGSARATVDAWFYETNMYTNGTPGHQMWIMNPRATSVGFAVQTVNGVSYIVGKSNVGQY